MHDDTLTLNHRELTVRRPHGGRRGLRGWDAADALILEQALAWLAQADQPRVLVVDDQFGALTLGLAEYQPQTVSDSALLAESLALNAPENAAPVDSWLTPPVGPFDLVVMRIPRQADYLAWLLRWLNGVLVPDGTLIAGGMIKHLPDRSVAVFGELVHTDTVCPAKKKARVVIARPGSPTLDGWDDEWRGYRLPGSGLVLEALPAVFARRKLDIGTQEILPFVQRAVSDLAIGSRVLDLACGNGVLGLMALSERADLQLTFSDVSSQALLSAKRNVAAAVEGGASVFCHADGVPRASEPFDLILLNPPFHEGGVVGDHIALRLFDAAARALAPGGRLLMVGNRHLGYHQSLKRAFRQVKQLGASSKFVVFEASQDTGRS